MSEMAQLERDFLLDRLVRKHDHTFVGASSDAMVIEALTGQPPTWWPADHADLERCENTFKAAPAHLQLLMQKRLGEFRAHVKKREASRRA